MAEPQRWNEQQILIMRYAEAVREQRRIEKLAAETQRAAETARDTRQEIWRTLKALKPTAGVYRVGRVSATHEEGLLIGTGDYPEVFPMFDAHA